MSIEAISLALGVQIKPSSAKFVLVAMANCADHEMRCWPSMAYLSAATSQDRKTVLENMKRLKLAHLIAETLERKGATRQVVVYVLNIPKNGTLRTTAETVPETVPVPKTEPVPKTAAKGPVFPVKGSRFSAERVPKTGHGTVKEPSEEPSGNQKKETAEAVLIKTELPDIPPGLLADWLTVRKAKKAPLTKTAIDQARREADKAGLTLAQSIEYAVSANWQAFNAKWYGERQGQSAPGRQTNGRHHDPIAAEAALAAENARTTAEAKRLLFGVPSALEVLPHA